MTASFRAHSLLLLAACSATAAPAQTTTTPPTTIVITADRTPQPLSAVLGDVSVIDRQAIERAGVVGVADLLARLPGIEFSRSGGPAGTTGVFVRGSEARHVAVYIDGVRLDSQATGGAPWEQIPLDQIDRIEVLRGPAAAVYGSDAVGGVIQLFTRRGQGAATPTAAAAIGTYRTGQLQAGVSGAAQGFDYAVSGSVARSDGFDARTLPTTDPDDDGWHRRSVQARLGYQLTSVHRVDASVLASRLETQYDGFAIGSDDRSRQTLRTGSLAWQGRWNDAATTRVQAGETRTVYTTRPSPYRSETTLRNAVLQHDQRIGDSNRVGLILERRDDALVNPATPFATRLDGRRHQNAAALSWRGDFGDHGLQAHVRRDDDSEFGGKTTGSLAWGWTFAPQWRATAAAANAFRVPTLYQRFSQYGNADLVPETGRNLELGLRWTPAAASEVSLVAWRNTVDHLIAFGSAGPCADPFGCYVNVGHSRLRGATLAGRSAVAGVTLRGSIDWHDPRNLDTDKLLQRRARRLATAGADTRAGAWTLGAEVQAASTRWEDAANTQRLGGYALVNVLVSRTLARGLALEGRVDNVGDRTYALARGYATPGRNAQLAVRWTMP